MIEVQPPVMAITLKREHVHHIHGNNHWIWGISMSLVLTRHFKGHHDPGQQLMPINSYR